MSDGTREVLPGAAPAARGSRPRVRLAIVGCGAIVEGYHLPAALAEAGCEVTILVDTDLERVQALAQRTGVPAASKDYLDVIGKADAALLALPNHVHADIASDLLARGIHVLVEKPMAITVPECDRMIAAAEQADVVLGIAQLRRFWAPVHFVKDALERGVIGRVKSFEIVDGWMFGWPLRSPYLFMKSQAGGGCLMDMAPHLIDLLLHWLGDLTVLEYRDDAYGGVEANCWIKAATADGATGTIDFSRARTLGANIKLVGEKGTLEMGAGKPNILALSFDGKTQLTGGGIHTWAAPAALASAPPGSGRPVQREKGEDFDLLFGYQIKDFVEAVRGEHPVGVSGLEGRRVVDFVQACYAQRQPLQLSFMSPVPRPLHDNDHDLADEALPAEHGAQA